MISSSGLRNVTGNDVIIAAAAALLGVVVVVVVSIPLQQQQQQAYAAAQTITTVEKIRIDETSFVPCAAGGAGEEIQLTGQANIVFHGTLDNAGGAHIKLHGNYKGVIGTGLTTGDKYRATAAVNEVASISKEGEESYQATLLTKINFIGQGDASNFLARMHAHLTVHADGTLTGIVINISLECR
ncbi:MAG TPA: hypothetical protein VKA09_16980 [Nitrososphaeraceae archaeon]|nr:hypothetical protein [Nitrososphaeraceae archaeon]